MDKSSIRISIDVGYSCIRLFIEDARWLNEEFIDLPYGHSQGTRVVITSP